MKRRLLNLLTALSLLLCVAVCVLWARSYYAVPLESHFAGWKAYRHGGTYSALRHTGVWSSRGMLAAGVNQSSWDDAYNLELVRTRLCEGVGGPGVETRNYLFPRRWPERWKLERDKAFPTDFFAGRHQWNGRGFGSFAAGVALPHWFVAGMLLIPPAARAAVGLRRARLLAGGRCSLCGYDLRATPGRCPECGASVLAGPGGGPIHVKEVV